MSSEFPTIASCLHCRSILLRTPRALVHPMTGERDRIVRVLGRYWVDQARVRFDGRFHHCPTLERRVVQEGRQEPAGGRRVHCTLAALAALLLLPCSSPGQEDPARLLLEAVPAASTEARDRDMPRFPAPALAPGAQPRSRVARTGAVRQAASRWRPAGSLAPSREPVGEVALDVAPEDRAVGTPGPEGSGREGTWLGSELANGRYQVVDTIREGKAGVVYLAHDRNLDTHVVVEVPRVATADSPSRLVHAAKLLARLEHPNLVKVTAVGTHRDAPFVVTEHLSGGSLRFRRPVGPDGRPSPASPASLRDWLGEVAAALDYLHSQDRVYRGLSPASILFDAQGRAYLGGLGMSAAVAPEPAGGGSTDVQADQHALAATVYEMLSGRRPGDGSSDLRHAASTIPAPLSDVVDRGLSDDPRRSFDDCVSFARAALSAARQPGVPRTPRRMAAAGRPRVAPAPIPNPDRRTDSRAWPAIPRGYLALGVAGSLALAVAAAWLGRKRDRHRVPATPAQSDPVVGRPIRRLAALGSGGRLTAVPAVVSRDREPGGVARSAEPAAPLPAWRPEGCRVLGHPPHAKLLPPHAELEGPPGPVAGRVGSRLFPLPLPFPIPPLLQFLQPRTPEVGRRRAS